MTLWSLATLAVSAALALAPIARASPPGPMPEDPALVVLEIVITGIRSDKGMIQLALCPPGAGFPDCGDQAVRTASLPIRNGEARVALTGLAPGSYAISVFHDANGNGKLDTFAGIPREGYGFSSNPPFRPRAPRFAECEVVLAQSAAAAINLRYLV